MPENEELGRLVNEISITYSVRELLARIEERQVRVDEKMGNLASRAEVEALAEIVTKHEARWQRVIGMAIGLSAATGGLSGFLTSVLTKGAA